MVANGTVPRYIICMWQHSRVNVMCGSDQVCHLFYYMIIKNQGNVVRFIIGRTNVYAKWNITPYLIGYTIHASGNRKPPYHFCKTVFQNWIKTPKLINSNLVEPNILQYSIPYFFYNNAITNNKHILHTYIRYMFIHIKMHIPTHFMKNIK